MAGSTRFELATSGVTGRRSNQLNYDPAWVTSRRTTFVLACQPSLQQQRRLVGGTGFEPVTAGV